VLHVTFVSAIRRIRSSVFVVIGPSPQLVADTLEVPVAAHDLSVARDGSNPRAQPDVRRIREVHRRKAHQRGAIHARGGDPELADQAVRSLQMLDELELRAPHVGALEEGLLPKERHVDGVRREQFAVTDGVANQDRHEIGGQRSSGKLD
jgi:hypothetical protein